MDRKGNQFGPCADFDFALNGNVVCIVDLYEGGRTVTNDAEAVIELVFRQLTEQCQHIDRLRVIYRHSRAISDEMVVSKGQFIRFAPSTKTDRGAALAKLRAGVAA